MPNSHIIAFCLFAFLKNSSWCTSRMQNGLDFFHHANRDAKYFPRIYFRFLYADSQQYNRHFPVFPRCPVSMILISSITELRISALFHLEAPLSHTYFSSIHPQQRHTSIGNLASDTFTPFDEISNKTLS